MLNTQLANQQQEYLELIKNASRSLLSLLNTIIDFSNTETGAMRLNESSFRFSDTVNKALAPLILQAERSTVKLTSNIAADTPDVLTGDHEMLKNVLTYIVENSIKFTQKGRISVDIRPALYNLSSHTPIVSIPPVGLRNNRQSEGTDDRADNSYVVLLFSVRDTGIGIAADKLRVIFDSFTQVDGSMTRKYGGMGLGLAIAKCLVNMMHGEIWVESVQGKGSLFQFTAWFKLSDAYMPGEAIPQQTDTPQADIQYDPWTTHIEEDNDTQPNLENWNVFVGNYATELENLKNAIEKNDSVSVERYAHVLKDMFAQVGITSLKNEAFRIEMASRKKDMTKVETAFNNLKDGYITAIDSDSYNDYLQRATASTALP
ncbi:ATP-binding region, ATPase-like domain protein [Candidatus Magnetobacterium bavaricum]|uniref:histidine kinase n=1 Tax=Candidatus Magnetobacterium bavaricum TaxID=29290 RepID=A0A0F3GZQ8_9BACT|nr:ATP-binding region, ATPase-like domain protein [Candidatus Magnetobacterium bavaricum]